MTEAIEWKGGQDIGLAAILEEMVAQATVPADAAASIVEIAGRRTKPPKCAACGNRFDLREVAEAMEAAMLAWSSAMRRG